MDHMMPIRRLAFPGLAPIQRTIPKTVINFGIQV